MKLNVIVATYNRVHLLENTLKSFLEVNVPNGHQITITVVDNNSADGTKELLEVYTRRFGGRLLYLFEERQGKTWALNTGINASAADLVGFVDDDEEVDPQWLAVAIEAFQRTEVAYIGGITLPKFLGPVPSWLPTRYGAVIGQTGVDVKDVTEFGAPYDGFPAGGNLVMRRSILCRLGREPYPTHLGRKGRGLLTADFYFYQRLRDLCVRGFFYPGLVVYHAVQPYMLTKQYYRRWIFFNEASCALNEAIPREMPRLFGIPRWYYRMAVEALFRCVYFRMMDPREAFASELDCLRLAGFVYGRRILGMSQTAELPSMK